MQKFQGYVKKRPDAFRFAPLPSEVVENVGTIQKEFIQLGVLSRVVGGVVYGVDKTIALHNKQDVTVRVGQTWCSQQTLQEDISAATGTALSYRQIRYAIEKAKKAGLLTAANVGPKGCWGKIFTPSTQLLMQGDDMIDVIQKYRIYRYGDVSEYRVGEAVTKDFKNRGRYNTAQKWINHVARKGVDYPAWTTVGRWKEGEQGNRASSVFLPWITIDVDRGRFVDRNGLIEPDGAQEAYDDTVEITERLLAEGFDPERVFVSFSGQKGFHIQISTDHFGCPIFYDAKAAQHTCATFVERFADDITTDATTNSPLSLIRITGSVHNDTGIRKKTWTARRFMSMNMIDVYGQINTFEPFEYPDPTQGDVEDRVLAEFEASAVEAAETIRKEREAAERVSTKQGDTIKRILSGIAEGEVWSDTHVGRNKAAFILACWVVESQTQNEGVATELGLPATTAPGDVLKAWNKRNKPGLPEYELTRCLRSAYRRIRSR